MNACAPFRRLLHESLDGPLGRAEQARLEAHLATCPACRELARDLRGMTADLAALPAVPMPADLRRAIRARTVEAPGRRFRRVVFLAAAAAVALAFSLWPALHPRPAGIPGADPRALAAARQVRFALAVTGREIAAAGRRGLTLSVGDALAPAIARGSREGLAAALEPPLDLAERLVRPAPASRPQEDHR